MFSGNALARLKKTHYGLEDLPDALCFPEHSGRPVEPPVLINKATLDDIAFAIVAADQECSAVIRRSSSLKQLYELGRKAGAIGTDIAVAAALNAGGMK
jgi:hypothetical protein